MTIHPQILAFLERIVNDPAVKLRFDGVLFGSKCAGDVTDIANELGYDFTLEEFLAFRERIPTPGVVALDDAALDDVAGGLPEMGPNFSPVLKSIASSLVCCGECLEERRQRAQGAVALDDATLDDVSGGLPVFRSF